MEIKLVLEDNDKVFKRIADALERLAAPILAEAVPEVVTEKGAVITDDVPEGVPGDVPEDKPKPKKKAKRKAEPKPEPKKDDGKMKVGEVREILGEIMKKVGKEAIVALVNGAYKVQSLDDLDPDVFPHLLDTAKKIEKEHEERVANGHA